MPGMSTMGAICSGHDCYPPRQVIAWSSNVFANSKGCCRQYDAWGPHCRGCGKSHPCHVSFGAKGASRVYINGRQALRIGDPIACGSVVATASKNVGCGS